MVEVLKMKLYMCLYNRRIGKKIRSAAMEATAADSLSDTAATAAVLRKCSFCQSGKVQTLSISAIARCAYRCLPLSRYAQARWSMIH